MSARFRHSGHIFGRVVGFEVACLECYPAIACGVALVEGVGGEFFPFRPYLLEYVGLVPVFLAAFKEFVLKLVHLCYELFTHGLAEGVALAARESCEEARQEHDLFLIYRDAVCVLEVRFHLGYVVHYGRASVLAGNEVGNVLHRAGAVQRVHGDEVLEHRRLKLAQVALHTG